MAADDTLKEALAEVFAHTDDDPPMTFGQLSGWALAAVQAVLADRGWALTGTGLVKVESGICAYCHWDAPSCTGRCCPSCEHYVLLHRLSPVEDTPMIDPEVIHVIRSESFVEAVLAAERFGDALRDLAQSIVDIDPDNLRRLAESVAVSVEDTP